MRLLLICLFTIMASGIQAQQITGVAKDAQSNPLVGATVSLMKDSSVVKLGITKEKGVYTFSGIKEGRYRIAVSYVGFLPVASQTFTFSNSDVTVPAIQMAKAPDNMNNVVVSTRKPIIEVKADKTILNVEGTMNATGTDALELLRRSPGVTVDKDENLTLAGKNGVQVYIDNRPTPLSGQDLANYLKTLQSSQIESIEIITNPSAKYEAAGNAGIINIRLKKNKAFGTNGSVNLGYNVGVYSKYNGSFNLNYRNKNWNIYGTYSYNQAKNQMSNHLGRSILDSTFDTRGTIVFGQQSHNFKVGADYTINKKSSIGVLLNGIIGSPDVETNSTTVIGYAPTQTTNRILVAENSSSLQRNNYNANLNYNYTGTDGKTLTLNADKGYYDLSSNQFQPNTYYDATGVNKLSTIAYRMISPSTIDINSFKADYEQNFAKGKLGLGGKTAFINTDNDFKRYNVYSSGDQLDRDRSNRFQYKENINAVYANYNRAFKGWMLQAGLRVENTVTKGTSDGEKYTSSGYVPSTTVFNRNYTDFFPSAALTFNKNPKKQWSLTYSRRIDRPAYQDLNPFEMKLDEYTFMKGNTELMPQYTNSFGIINTYNFRLTTSLNYSHIGNLFTQILDTAEKTKVFNTKRNLASQDIVSINISYPFSYKNYSAFASLNSFYTQYKADFGSGRKIDLNTFGLTFVTQQSLKFAKTWTGELIGFYNAPSIYQGTFQAHALYSIDAGLSKQVLQGKGTIKASVSDIFHTLKFDATSDFAGQHADVNARWESRQFKLSMIFRFGSNTVKAAKQKTSGAEDELKRAQDNGGGMGAPVKQ